LTARGYASLQVGLGSGHVRLIDLRAEHWMNASTYPITDAYTAYHLGPNGFMTTAAPGRWLRAVGMRRTDDER